jgi:hypothetical protein
MSKLEKILLCVTIVSTSFSIVQNFKAVKEALGFPDKPKWDGRWKMQIGSKIIGNTETVFRLENGKLIGSYVIHGENEPVLTTQMTGIITDDETYNGDWFQFSDSTFQSSGRFNLILRNDNTFQGTFSKIRKDGSKISDLKWKGEKIR